MPPAPAPPPAVPREAKRRRLTVDQTVEARRCRLRTALHAAAASAAVVGGCATGGVAGGAADAVASVAEEHQRQELAFDEGLGPALEFMGVMGASPAAVFKDLLADLGRQLTEKLRSGRREVVERVLSDMLQHVAVPCIRDLIASVLQRLADLPPPGDLERQALSVLAEAYLKDRAAVEHLPAVLQRRIWEMQPRLFFGKVRPLVAEFIHKFRRGFGQLLIELRQRAPEQRRRENAALQQLADLVGQQPGLYRAFCKHLSTVFQEAAAKGTPAARMRQGEGNATAVAGEGEGPPVSVGPEHVLSTLRSELLMLLVDRKILKRSVAGSWEIKSEPERGNRALRYTVTLAQQAGVISGTSKLEGISRLEGTLQDSKLSFKQHGGNVTYVCCCDVSPDFQILSFGKWHQEPGSDGSEGEGHEDVHGTFSGTRIGPVRYADSTGEVWDELCPLIAVLDQIHQRKAALDSSILPAIQGVAKGYADAAEAAAPGATSAEEFAFALSDPCVVQSVLRGLLSARGEGDTRKASTMLSTEARVSLQFLLCAAHATPQRRCPGAAGAGQPAVRQLPGSLDFLRLGEVAPLQEALTAVGLRGELLAAALRKHGKKDVDSVVDAGGKLNAELSEALQSAARGPAHQVLRMLLNTLTNKCLLFRQSKALKECLELSQLHAPASCDWVQLQEVDILVGAATQLGEWFDVNLRRIVTEHLFPLARRDPWVHHRVAELLTLYQRNIASSREEMTALQDMLNNGSLEDAHYKWWRELAQLYLPTVQGKSYLLDIYRDSKLGRYFPLEDEKLRAPAAALSAIPSEGAEILQAVSPAPTSDGAETTPPSVGVSGEPARRVLGAEDGLMSPGVGDSVREFCSEHGSGERVTEVVELLAASFRGYHWLSHLAAKWVVVLGAASSSPQTVTAEGLVRSLLSRKMVAEFDPQRADPLLMPVNGTPHMPEWLDPLIQVKEWRGVIYELAKQYRGQASSFLSAVLLQISEAESYKDELLSNTSSTSNFIVFCRTLRSGLTRFFMLLNEDESRAAPAVADICMACSFSEYTYVYAQAVLRHLMHIRPRERPQLRHLSQALTDSASEKSDNVLQLDLRFTSAGQYPEIFGILYSMCRLGHEIRIVPADVVRLCGLVEGLLEWKVPRSSGAASQRSGCESPTGAASVVRQEGGAAAVEAAAGDSGSEHGTEAMSDVGSWLDPEEERNAWVGVGSEQSEGEEDGEDGEGRSRRVYVSVASSSAAPGVSSTGDRSGRRPPQPATEQSERTASIFHMPAVSSAASGAQVAHGEAQAGEPGGPAPGAGVGGVLEALRCPAILEALLSRFVDPYIMLSTREHRAFAKLLAIATVDGLCPTDANAAEKQDTAKEAAAAMATAAAEELEHVYQVVRNSKHSWLKRMAAMIHLQRHAVSSMAGLQWLMQSILSKQVAASELLVRMSQALLFMLLRRACDAHPPQVKTVLRILGHILEIMPHALSDLCNEDNAAAQAPDVQRLRVHKMVATTLTYLILAHMASMLVFEFATSTASSWDATMRQLFVTELLTSIQPPYSLRFAWSTTRLLAMSEMLDAVADSQRARTAALAFCEACHALEAPVRTPTDEVHFAELRANAEAIQGRLLSEKVQLQVQGPPAGGVAPGKAIPTVVHAAAATTGETSAESATVEKGAADLEAYSQQHQLWEWWSSTADKKKKQKKTETSTVINPKKVMQANAKRAAASEKEEGDMTSPGPAGKRRRSRGKTAAKRRQAKRRPKPMPKPSSSSSSDSKPKPSGKAKESDSESARCGTEDEKETRDGEVKCPPQASSATQGSGKLGGQGVATSDVQIPNVGAGASCSSVTSHIENADIAMGTPAPKRRLCLRMAPSSNVQASSEPHIAPASTPLPASGSVGNPAFTPRASPDQVTSPSSPALQCLTPAGDFELDLAALQGRWNHSFSYLGMLSVNGDAVLFDNGMKFTLRVLSRGVVEMSGWIASREQSTGCEIVWNQSGGGEQRTCSWKRPVATDQRGQPKGARQRGTRR